MKTWNTVLTMAVVVLLFCTLMLQLKIDDLKYNHSRILQHVNYLAENQAWQKEQREQERLIQKARDLKQDDQNERREKESARLQVIEQLLLLQLKKGLEKP